MPNNEDIKRYLGNRQKEIDGAALYSVLAETEKQPQMAEVYKKLAASEEKHAAGWEKKLIEANVSIPTRKPTWRAATMIWLAKRFGPQFVLPTITGNEKADSRAYDGQSDEEAREFSLDEKSHARLLSMASESNGWALWGISRTTGRTSQSERWQRLTRRSAGRQRRTCLHFEFDNGCGGRNKFKTRYFDRGAGRRSGGCGFHGVR